MRELKDVLREAERLDQKGGAPYVVATVVRVEGSAYRHEGARMLVRPDGGHVGTVSGGCLEGEIAHQAGRVLAEGRPEVLAFEQQEGDDPFGFGSGCGGTVHVLLEPAGRLPGGARPRAFALDLIRHCFEARRAGALATVYRAEGTLAGQQGRHLLRVQGSATLRGDLDAPQLRRGLVSAVETALCEARPRAKAHEQPGGRAEVLIEIVRPPLRLLLFGEGPDVGPLLRLAGILGWEGVVVGEHPAPTLKAHFPHADRCISAPDAETLLEQLHVSRRDAAVAISHNHVRDRTVLRRLQAKTASLA